MVFNPIVIFQSKKITTNNQIDSFHNKNYLEDYKQHIYKFFFQTQIYNQI